ncbi:amidohydrolase family protein [Clostridia bacterium]|nr:amidohydrolase family protein [Clostridia bacterium]
MSRKTLIQNVHLFEKEGLYDVLIGGGLIEKIVPFGSLKDTTTETYCIDGEKGFLSAGFIDLHMHLEKTHTIGDNEYPGLMDAIMGFNRYVEEKIGPEETENRIRKTLDNLICHGTTSLRTHISVDETLGTMAIEAMVKIKEEYKDKLDIQIIAMLSALTFSDTAYAYFDQVGTMDIDGYGSAPALCDAPKLIIDKMFDLAQKHGKFVDIHSDEHDMPNVDVTNYFAEQIIARNMIGECSAGHLCSLSAVDEKTAAETIEKIVESGMNIITLPSCNLYLMGRNDIGTVRRGTTRIKQLYEAGANISLASDNIRDPFRPFGNGDMLEEALLTAQVAQMGTYSDLRAVYRMATMNPAKAMGKEKYGTVEGAPADLVLLEANSAEEAILSQSNKRYVFKRGEIICENRRWTKMIEED